jgi:hypothetical protein
MISFGLKNLFKSTLIKTKSFIKNSKNNYKPMEGPTQQTDLKTHVETT